MNHQYVFNCRKFYKISIFSLIIPSVIVVYPDGKDNNLHLNQNFENLLLFPSLKLNQPQTMWHKTE